MFEHLLSFLRGSLVILIYGVNPERYLTLCASAGLTLLNLRRTKDGYLAAISLPDYRSSLPLARKSHTLLHIVKKSGLPFHLYRNRTRKACFAGLLLGLGLWSFLTLFLWDIQVEGNQYYTEDVLLNYLKEQQVVHGMRMSAIACDELEQAIRIQYPHITWVSAQISGTRLILHIKENFAQMELVENEKVPCDLIAVADGVITSMVARSGVPSVKVGDTVTAGQVLVSGRIPIHNDAGEVVAWHEVTADADIRAQTVVPYHWQRSILKEERESIRGWPCGICVRLGSRQLTFGRQTAEKPSHFSISEHHRLSLFYNRELPLSFSLTTDTSYQTRVRKLSESEMNLAAESAFAEYQEQLAAEGTRILGKDLSQNTDALWLTVTGTLTVEQDFGRENPLPEIGAEENLESELP